MIMTFTEEQFTALYEKIDAIEKSSVAGYMGNPKARLMEINSGVKMMRSMLLDATIVNDGPDAA